MALESNNVVLPASAWDHQNLVALLADIVASGFIGDELPMVVDGPEGESLNTSGSSHGGGSDDTRVPAGCTPPAKAPRLPPCCPGTPALP